jgi:hypothetical protein
MGEIFLFIIIVLSFWWSTRFTKAVHQVEGIGEPFPTAFASTAIAKWSLHVTIAHSADMAPHGSSMRKVSHLSLPPDTAEESAECLKKTG